VLTHPRANDAAPIAVYYTTDRAGFSRPRNLSGKIQRGQSAAYHRALVKKQVNYKDFMQRYRVLAADAGAENPYYIGRRGVDVIERALQIFLDGFSNLRVAENPPRLMVDKGRTPLDLAQLSDGQRSVLAMVSDLCKRLANHRSATWVKDRFAASDGIRRAKSASLSASRRPASCLSVVFSDRRNCLPPFLTKA
jgi:predicted ATP-binding protein involved in virulence